MSGSAGLAVREFATAIEEAAAAVRAVADQFREDATSHEEVDQVVTQLAAAVLTRAQGAGAVAGVRPPKNRLARRLLDLLRRAFVERLAARAPAIEAGVLLPYLTAFEELGREYEPSWEQRFTDRLSGPDGLELMVEVAHDLRSPLTSILFLAETLQRGRSGPVSPLQQRQIGLIYSAAFGLSSIASDVIELARGGDSLLHADPMAFSIEDILESVRDIVQPIAEEKGLEVRVRPPVQATRVGQPMALSRVMLNLTTNALKFTDQGFVEIAGSDQGNGRLELSVRDTGRGMDLSEALLFEPFRRRRQGQDYAFSGTGLGLSICRRLVEAMGGELQVETGARGTRFHFILDLPSVDPRSALLDS